MLFRPTYTQRKTTHPAPNTAFFTRLGKHHLLILLSLFFFYPAANGFAGEATLSWLPNTEPDLAGYYIHYGTTSRNYSSKTDIGKQTTYTISGLGLGTYYFAVTARDAAGNESAFSAEASKTFKETTPPVLSNITADSISTTGARVTWNTDEPANSRLEYGLTTGYGITSPLDNNFVTAHSRTLSGLLPATLYHYRVISADKNGNVAISSEDYTFTTTSTPDTAPPILSGISGNNTFNTGAVIQWNTNEAATSLVEYGTSPGYGSFSPLNNNRVTAHSRTLSGLSPATLYHYRVISTDLADNKATSADFTFTTTSIPDTAPPLLSSIRSDTITFNSAVILWGTDEAASSQVYYGESNISLTSSTLQDQTLSNAHQVLLRDLKSNQQYHYRVESLDPTGNIATSTVRTFTTLLRPEDLTTPLDSESQTETSTSGGGGCGMILPKDGGGDPPGPGESAGMLSTIGFLMALLFKNGLKNLQKRPCRLTET